MAHVHGWSCCGCEAELTAATTGLRPTSIAVVCRMDHIHTTQTARASPVAAAMNIMEMWDRARKTRDASGNNVTVFEIKHVFCVHSGCRGTQNRTLS